MILFLPDGEGDELVRLLAHESSSDVVVRAVDAEVDGGGVRGHVRALCRNHLFPFNFASNHSKSEKALDVDDWFV